jgi:hypothetical protein
VSIAGNKGWELAQVEDGRGRTHLNVAARLMVVKRQVAASNDGGTAGTLLNLKSDQVGFAHRFENIAEGLQFRRTRSGVDGLVAAELTEST